MRNKDIWNRLLSSRIYGPTPCQKWANGEIDATDAEQSEQSGCGCYPGLLFASKCQELRF